MSESKKKKAEKSEDKEKIDRPLKDLVLDVPKDRYRLVATTIRWAQELKKRNSVAEPIHFLVDTALKDILTDQVSIEEVEKLPAAVPEEPKPEPPPKPPVDLLEENGSKKSKNKD